MPFALADDYAVDVETAEERLGLEGAAVQVGFPELELATGVVDSS